MQLLLWWVIIGALELSLVLFRARTNSWQPGLQERGLHDQRAHATHHTHLMYTMQNLRKWSVHGDQLAKALALLQLQELCT